MKRLISHTKYSCLLLVMLLTALRLSAQRPIQVDETPFIASCQLDNGSPVTVSVPSEALTGDNIALNITLPGTFSAGCVKKVTITKSPNLLFQASGGVPFQPLGGNVYESTGTLPGNDGQNFNVFFRFPPYVTCNGTTGILDVEVELDCNGQKTVCRSQVAVVARAENYWSVRKEFLHGNLACGVSVWAIRLEHNNPNPAGLGVYSLSGTLTETIGLPIVSGGNFAISGLYPSGASASYPYIVYIQNCASEGAVITNTAHYDFTLGNNCGTMEGDVSAVSPPMASPNASLSFHKQVLNAANTSLSPGCQGQYYISINNNGNVPWTNITVTDALPSGISPVGAPNLPSGWTSTWSGGTYTFQGGSQVLMPGQTVGIYIPFTIDPLATPGSSIVNTANISYQVAGPQTSGGGGSAPASCPGINCPQIDTAIQNDVARTTFVVEEPRPVPSIKKCIIDPPNAVQPPIYQIGNVIRFRINVGNSGAASLSSVINDALGAPNQHLQIIPSSIQYAYYEDIQSGYINSCNYNGIPEPSIPFTVTPNTSDLQNPTFTIVGMPGICQLNRVNMLTITFDAMILPQMHGTKTNTAAITTTGQPSKQSSVTYSIDQVGILGVHKRADQDYVENGQTFNYIIEVTNQGSVGLNNITLTDALPGCVQRAGDIAVRNALGNIVTGSSVTGNIQIALPAAEQLAPGATLTVTIPVQKVSGATCCNVTVAATARMVTSNQLLDANFGSELEPAACVRSVECCDVPGFEAQLVQRDGRFYLQLTGGAVPLQEVDVNMLDFHVEYSSPDCKPVNMGVFGQLSTTTNTVGGLVLSNGTMPAGSLSWGLGTASVINGQTIELEITDPAILDIPCCEFELTFCLKVRVKDVNCNVCEKTICYTAEPATPPCDLANLELNSPLRICPGQTLSFTWSGDSPSGGVDIYLVNAANPNDHHVIATGVSNGINSYTYTLPANFPCEGNRQWTIIVKDPKSDCMIASRRFTVICCEPRCDCGTWVSSDVRITQAISADNGNVQFERNDNLLKIASNVNVGVITRCGETARLNKGSYVFTAPNFGCSPDGCPAVYRWEIQRAGDVQATVGLGKSFSYQFAQNGIYTIRIIPICGGKECDPCQIQVRVGRIIGTVHPDVAIDMSINDLLP